VITPSETLGQVHGGVAAAADAVAQAQQQQQQQAVQTPVGSQGLLDEANKPLNPVTFRSQAELTVTDNSTEAHIPGLDNPDIAAVKRAIPDVDHWAPVLTALTPFLPDLHDISNSIGFYLPVNWNLADTGPTGDWLRTYLGSYWSAFWGQGPRPRQAPLLLVANKDVSYMHSQHNAATSWFQTDTSGIGTCAVMLQQLAKGV
jgi:hypothetical protein